MPEDLKNDQDLSDVVKNPRRAAPVQRKYEPEYVRLGKEPIIKPDAEMYASVDDVSIDVDGQEMPATNGHIVDNNEFVNFGVPEHLQGVSPNKTHKPVVEETTEQITTPEVGDYILMVLGKLIASGSLEQIEARVKAIIYSEDSTFSGLEVGVNDVIVLKRIGIKIGVFLGD